MRESVVCLLDFGTRVHHERPMLRYRLSDGLSYMRVAIK
jgi:hypothetical protein